ncbi:MAG: DMT family transporter [Terriglobia bacterium]
MIRTRSKAEILLVIVTFFWGATFVVVKEALADASPVAFIAARFLVAGGLLVLVFGRRRLSRRALGPSLVLGLLLFAGYVFQTWGQEYTTPSKCAFITAFSVVLVPLILVFVDAPLRWGSAAGALMGLGGIYLLVVPSGAGGLNRGDVLTLFAATAFAVYIVLLERYSRAHSFVDLAPAQILLVGVLGGLAWPLGIGWRIHWTGYLAAAVLLTAVFATAFAFAVQNWAQRYVPAAHAALIFALEPVFAALVSVVIIHERLGSRLLIGSALILAGVGVSERWGSGTGREPLSAERSFDD